MTKAALVKQVHVDAAVSKTEASRAVETILGLMKRTLGGGERILVTNFGSFEVLDRRERRGRNPATGEIIPIRPRRTVVFRSAQKLELRLNPA